MTMRFGINEWLVLLKGKMSIIIEHSWDLLLFHYCNLFFVHTEIVIFLKKFDCLLVGIIRSHNGQRNFNSLVTELLLIGQNIVDVIMHESLSCEQFKWNRDLDTRVTQSLSESTSNQNKSDMVKLFQSDSFVVLDFVGSVKMEIYSIRFPY